MNLITIASYVIALLTAVEVGMLLGDYLGYKVGRMRLFTTLGIIWLAAVIIFAIVIVVNTFLSGR